MPKHIIHLLNDVESLVDASVTQVEDLGRHLLHVTYLLKPHAEGYGEKPSHLVIPSHTEGNKHVEPVGLRAALGLPEPPEAAVGEAEASPLPEEVSPDEEVLPEEEAPAAHQEDVAEKPAGRKRGK